MFKTAKTVAPAIILIISCTAFGQGRTARQARNTPARPATATETPVHTENLQIGGTSKTTAEDRQSVEVTIYNNNLGLVKEMRKIGIPDGVGELQFIDVPAQINPVTVHVRPLAHAADFSILEQNYAYDLISHHKLMDKYIGRTIRIMQWNEHHDRKEIVEAKLLSVDNGEVYKIGDEIYLGHPGIKILPELPGDLISRPTLSWIYRNKTERAYDLEVSYLTYGMDWSADYILSVGSDNKNAGLSGWVTVNNTSGAAFENAKLKLVAGEVNRVRQPQPMMFRGSRHNDMAVMSAAAPEFEQTELFEYYMYDLQRPTTIKNNQTKQINLMESHGVAVVQEYTTIANFNAFGRGTDGQPVKQPVNAFFTIENSKHNQLGNPLPAGIVRIYTADAQGRKQFIGEDRITHTPRDETIRLKVGEAFDIVAERTQLEHRQISGQMFEAEFELALRNRKQNEDIIVGVVERAHGTWEIVKSSHKHTRTDANTFRFDVPVGAGKEVTIKYRICIGI